MPLANQATAKYKLQVCFCNRTRVASGMSGKLQSHGLVVGRLITMRNDSSSKANEASFHISISL